MRVGKVCIALAMGIVVTLGSGCNPDKNKLLFKPQQDSKRNVDTYMAVNTSLNFLGMAMNFGSATIHTFETMTKSIDEAGTATIDVTIKSLNYEITGMDNMMGAGMPKVPGASENNDPLGMKSLTLALRAAEGQTFTTKVNKLGEVIEVTGANAIAEKASAEYKSPPVFGNKISPKEVFTRMIGDDAMRNILKLVFTQRPDTKLNVGDSWKENVTNNQAVVDIAMDATYTVKARSGGVVQVDNAAQIDIKPSADTLNQLGSRTSLTVDLTGQGTGTLKFDEATGWLVEAIANAQVPGSLSMSVPQMGNMSIPIDATYKVSVKSYSPQ
jgi:hypothetical protein